MSQAPTLPLGAPGRLPSRFSRSGRVPRVLGVRPFDNPLRWFVESETQGGEHLVDLGAYQGNGECTCRHFVCRLAPELRQGRSPSNATRCKHILWARHRFCCEQIKALSLQYPSHGD